MPVKKKILLLYAAPDSGHAQVAQAMLESLSNIPSWEPVVEDLTRYFPRAGSIFVKLYKWVVTHHPGLWGHVHDNPAYVKAVHWSEGWLYRHDFFRVGDIVSTHHPQAIFATHALPLRSLASLKMKGGLAIPVVALVTDFRAHRYWAHREVDFYFASSEEARNDLIHYGVDSARIEVTGIPIRRAFTKEMSRDRARSDLGLDGNRPTLAVMGGSYGIVPDRLVESILKHPKAKSWNWIFVFGKNEKAWRRAQTYLKTKLQDKTERIRLFKFTHQVPAILRVSDILITKAGALTASEALAMEVPMILWRSIAGQEEKNAEFLIRHKVAIRERTLPHLLSGLEDLFNSSGKLEAMRQMCRNLAKPDAAQRIKKRLQEKGFLTLRRPPLEK